jgi:hypothetical protein
MRYVEFPPPQLCRLLNQNDPRLVPYKEFLDENVWTAPQWRQNEEFARARNRLMALFDTAFAEGRPGVGMSDKDYEKWEPIAALRGLQMPAENVRPVSVFTDTAMFASTIEPAWAKTAEAPSLPPVAAAPMLPAAAE